MRRIQAACFSIFVLVLAGANSSHSASLAAAPVSSEDYAAIEGCLIAQDAAKADRGACIGKVMEPCMQTPDGGSTYGMMDCQKREVTVWDRLLNETYNDLVKEASPKLKRTLRDAQRAWIKNRDKSCQIPYAYFEGGTIAGPMGGYCMNEFTAQRYIFLDGYLHFAE